MVVDEVLDWSDCVAAADPASLRPLSSLWLGVDQADVVDAVGVDFVAVADGSAEVAAIIAISGLSAADWAADTPVESIICASIEAKPPANCVDSPWTEVCDDC